MNHYKDNRLTTDEARDLYFRAKRKERRARRMVRTTIVLSVVVLAFAFLWNQNIQANNYYKDHCTQLESRAVGSDPNVKSVIWSCPRGVN